MRSTKAVVLLAVLLSVLVSNARGQIGNLDWVKGKERKQTDKEDAPLRLSLDLGVGAFKTSYGNSNWHNEDNGGRFNPGVGIDYRFLRTTTNESMIIDFALHASIGAIFDFDFSNVGIMGAIGPEIGVQLFVNSRTILKPFLSFGPGVIFEGASSDDPSLIWVPRAGLELHRKDGAWTLAIGAEYFSRERVIYQFKESHKEYIGFLSLGMRI